MVLHPSEVFVMPRTNIDKKQKMEIMTPEEVARFLKKSTSWVYKNWQKLGGVKLGGSLLFPRMEDLYELLFYQGERVALRLHPQRKTLHKQLVQDQKGGKKARSSKKGGVKESKDGFADSNRHGLLGTG
jgi:hypothetical protein